jgi:hypothetical protein
MKVHLIDNFLPEEEFQKIRGFIMGDCFDHSYPSLPWYYGKVLSENIKDFSSPSCNEDDNYQFSHVFYVADAPTSALIQNLQPLIESMPEVGCRSFVKIKANLNPRTDKIIEHGFHIDIGNFEGGKTAIYYLNTNDGYTKFETGETIESVENRLIIFDQSLLHTGTTCTDAHARYVINLNFF